MSPKPASARFGERSRSAETAWRVVVHTADPTNTPGTAHLKPLRDSLAGARQDWKQALTATTPHVQLVELLEMGDTTRVVDRHDPHPSTQIPEGDAKRKMAWLAAGFKNVERFDGSVAKANAKARMEGKPVATDKPLPGKPGWLLVQEEGVCGVCRDACWARDPEGRAVHPRCENDEKETA